MKKSLVASLCMLASLVVMMTVADASSKSTSHPHPTLKDKWVIGTDTPGWFYTDNQDYSHYLIDPAGYGSIAALHSKNVPIEVDKSKKAVGWAKARFTWQWNDTSGFHQLWGYWSY